MSKIKLLELCCSPSKGGLEMYFADISNQLSASFDMFHVVAPQSQVAENIRQQKHVLRLKKKAHYLPLFSARRLAKYIDKHGIQVIHMHWNKDLALAVFAKLLSNKRPKLVLMRHMQFPAKKDGLLHRFLYRNIDHIIAITNTMADDFRRFVPKDVLPRLSVNYLGVQPIHPAPVDKVAAQRSTYDPEQSSYLIGLFGRIDPHKGHGLLLDALLIAKKESLPFKALIVGHAMQDDYLKQLKIRVQAEGLEDYVVFTGFVKGPRQLMQACDVVVLATVEETFGLVLIEAMSVGVPVIGSNRGGVPEIIEHEKTGLLFESTDSKSLYEALLRLYHNSEIAAVYAKEALATVGKKFDADQHLKRMVSCLKAEVSDE